jgi:hypothetical protein
MSAKALPGDRRRADRRGEGHLEPEPAWPALVLAAVTIAVAAAPSSATFPGKRGRIAFNGVVPGTCCSEIFTANSDGSDLQRLTNTAGQSDSELPDWSPDGQKIAFDSSRTDADGQNDVVQIYLMNADGSGLTQLTRGPGEQANPGWSPDTTSLAIRADWGKRALAGIWIIPTPAARRLRGPRLASSTRGPARSSRLGHARSPPPVRDGLRDGSLTPGVESRPFRPLREAAASETSRLCCDFAANGSAPDRIRTCDLRFRRPTAIGLQSR